MMKFATAAVLATTTLVTAENVNLGDGTMRMKVNRIRSPHGGLASVLRDTKFTLD